MPETCGRSSDASDAVVRPASSVCSVTASVLSVTTPTSTGLGAGASAAGELLHPASAQSTGTIRRRTRMERLAS